MIETPTEVAGIKIRCQVYANSKRKQNRKSIESNKQRLISSETQVLEDETEEPPAKEKEKAQDAEETCRKYMRGERPG